MNNLPLISIIIPTLNEEKNIGRCLESIKKQTYPKGKIEVIVVDNNSKDHTSNIARKYKANVYNLSDNIDKKNVFNIRGAQLNYGVKKAKGAIIFFPDADMTFDKNLLFNIENMIKEGYDALYIPEKIIGRGYYGKVRDFERSFYNGTCIDAVRIVKKNIFLQVKGFDTKQVEFGPDDWDFTKKLKIHWVKFGITKNRLFHHEEEMTWVKHIQKKKLYINNFEKYIKKWGRNDPDIKRQIGIYYRLVGVFTEKGKWKRLFAKPHLTLGLYLMKLIIGFNFILRNK